MNNRRLSLLPIPFTILGLVSCSSIKPYFPDKQKDYRYSREIPRLRLPSDLAEHRVQELSIDPSLPVKSKQEKEPEIAEKTEEIRQGQVGEQRGRVELVGFAGGGLRLMVDEPLKKSWYIVGKALSRQAIEVTDRNQPASSFTIQYDPAKDEIDDGSLWNEFEFFFGEDRHLDQKFHVLLAENSERTEIVVTDEKGIPQTKGLGLGVLVVLFESIKEDLAGTPQ